MRRNRRMRNKANRRYLGREFKRICNRTGIPKRAGLSAARQTTSAKRRLRRMAIQGRTGSTVRRRQRQLGTPSHKHAIHPSFPTPVPTITDVIAAVLLQDDMERTGKRCYGLMGGANLRPERVEERTPDLYPAYAAVVERLAAEESKGDTEYQRLSASAFRRLHPTAQIAEFHKLGIVASTETEVLRIVLGEASTGSDLSTPYVIPGQNVKALSLGDVLHHEYYLTRRLGRIVTHRSVLLRDSGKLARTGKNPDHFTQMIQQIYASNRTLEADRMTLQQLHNRKTTLTRALRSQHPTSVFINSMNIPDVSTANRFEALMEDIDQLSPVLGEKICRITDDSDLPTTHWSPRRTRHTRRKPPQEATEQQAASTVDDPMRATLLHARDIQPTQEDITPDHCDVLFTLTGGYKTAQAATIHSTLKVTYLNAGGLTAHKLGLILEYMSQTQTDVLICVDAQTTEKGGRGLEKMVKQTLGPFSKVHYTAMDKPYEHKRHKYKQGTITGNLIGGQFCIINEKWGPSLVQCQDDPTGLGLLSQLSLRTADGQIAIFGTYWPNKHGENTDNASGSLWAKTQSWCHKNNITKSPIDFLRDLTLQWIHTAFKNNMIASILGGDLNATWEPAEQGGCYTLNKWALEHDFINGPLQIADHRGERFHTHQSGSWIDHVLHMGPLGHIDILAAHVSTGVEWKGITDHRPISATYRVSLPSTSKPVLAIPPPKRPELNRSDPRALADFDEAMRKYVEAHPYTATSMDEAGEYLFRLERATVRIVSRLDKNFGRSRARSSHKDGWSPHYAAMKIHLQTLLQMRRHTLGQHKCKQWKLPDEARHGISRLVDMWQARCDSLTTPDGAIESLMHLTGKGPEYWRLMVGIPKVEDIDADIQTLKSKMHGQLRTDLRSSINYHCARRETMRELGKTRVVLKSVLGRIGSRKHQDQLFLGAVKESSTRVDVTPLEVHEALTRHFQNWYAMPEHYQEDQLHNGDWESVIQSFPAFYSATAHTGVPENLCHLIYEAIQLKYRKPATCETLRAAFSTTPSFDEFVHQVRNLRNNSAPGMTGCSYNMIKAWPEPVLRAAYDSIALFWENRSVPDHWKWRWLVPIPKKPTDTPTLADLRPLMLTEATRKIWTSIIISKIQAATAQHDTLHCAQNAYLRNKGTNSASLLFINMLETAESDKTPAHRTSYDMSRAFDSVSKNIMRIAWLRLGVRIEI